VETRGQGFCSKLKICSYFGLWYALNVVYNIINKKVLNIIPAPLTVGSIQFGVGSLYTIILWVSKIRVKPTLTKEGKKVCFRLGMYHCIGMLLSMVSIGSGTVSFTHIVKASEPFFSSLVSIVLFGTWMKPKVYATLIPIVGGVSYACLNERSFSWLAFSSALGSNIAFAYRAVVSKAAMSSNSIGYNINSVNLFGVITLLAFLISISIAYIGEGMSFFRIWRNILLGSDLDSSENIVFIQLISSGLLHYLNNEVMYLALSNVHPVTLAVGNTLKRVVIMVFSLLVFRNPITFQVGFGCAVCVFGTLLYSLTKQFYEMKQA